MTPKRKSDPREGSALILALWTILILSLLISSFAFDMHIEAGIASYYRKRLKAEYLARAGMEEAIMLLSTYKDEDPEESAFDEEDETQQFKDRIENGVQINREVELGEGKFKLTIFPAESRRNVNKLDEEDWEELLELSGIDDLDMIDELIDCFMDWTDKNDEKHLNGAEADDTHYEDMEVEVKNAPLDTVDELTLIKGFSNAIVYGGYIDEEEEIFIQGIGRVLTAWGDGRVNPNSATPETLESMGMTPEQIEAGQGFMSEAPPEGSEFDFAFYESVDHFIEVTGADPELADKFVIDETQYFRVESIGTVGEGRTVSRAISAIIKVEENKEAIPVYWLEEHMR